MDQLTSEQVLELKRLYGLFDFSRTGKMNSRALGAVLRTIGVEISESELTLMMARISVKSASGEAAIDVEEFVHLMCESLDDADPAEEIDKAFQTFDVDNDGAVSSADLQAAATSLGIDLDKASAAEMLGEATDTPLRGASRTEFAAVADS